MAADLRLPATEVVSLMRGQRVVLIGESTTRQAFVCMKLWSLDEDCWIPSAADEAASQQIKQQQKNSDDPTSLTGPLLKHMIGVGELVFYPRPFYKNASDFLTSPRVQGALMSGAKRASLFVLGLGLHDLLYQPSLTHQASQLTSFLDSLAELARARVFTAPVLILGLPTLTDTSLNNARRSVSHFRDEPAKRVSSQISSFVDALNKEYGGPVLKFVDISDEATAASAPDALGGGGGGSKGSATIDGVHSTATAKMVATAVLDTVRNNPVPHGFSSTGLALFTSLVLIAGAFWVRFNTAAQPHHDDDDDENDNNGNSSSSSNNNNNNKDAEAQTTVVVAPSPPKPDPNPLFNLPLQNLTQIVCPLLLILFYLAMTDGPLRISSSTLKFENLDALLAIMCLLLAGSLLWGVKDLGEEKHPVQHLLNRHQTEEWKGLMMVCFLCYHIFRTEEVYNLIRVMVGAFVFLTGFGNAAFFMKCRDFSASRIIRVFLRINFFVLLVCAVLDIPYIFYYVCALHTWSFLIVYLTFLPTSLLDSAKPASPNFVLASVLCSALCAVLLFDTEIGHSLFTNVLFRPFHAVLSSPTDAVPLAEWSFRSRLDYLAVYFGMLTALAAPRYGELVAKIDAMPRLLNRVGARSVIAAACVFATAMWWRYWGSIENKYEYNQHHTYWEFVPMLAYLALRNLFAEARRRVLLPFQSLGTITLELYVMQCHTWMSDAAKSQLTIITGYPILNFFLTSSIMWYLSQYAFDATTVVIAHLAPGSNSATKILLNIGGCVLVFVVFLCGFALWF